MLTQVLVWEADFLASPQQELNFHMGLGGGVYIDTHTVLIISHPGVELRHSLVQQN